MFLHFLTWPHPTNESKKPFFGRCTLISTIANKVKHGWKPFAMGWRWLGDELWDIRGGIRGVIHFCCQDRGLSFQPNIRLSKWISARSAHPQTDSRISRKNSPSQKQVPQGSQLPPEDQLRPAKLKTSEERYNSFYYSNIPKVEPICPNGSSYF